MTYRSFLLILLLACLTSCTNNSPPADYDFPPLDKETGYLLIRTNGITGDTLNTRYLQGSMSMYDDGLFLDSDTSYWDTVSQELVRDESKEFIDIFISNKRGNRILRLRESYWDTKKTSRHFSSDYTQVQYDSIESLVSIFSTESELKFDFNGSTILFDFVFDGKPSNFELIMLEDARYDFVR